MPAFYRQSIQNAVNQQINIGKSKHRTTLNREAIGQVVSYCAVAAAHDLWDWGEKESTLLTLKMNNAASRYIMDHDKYGAPEALKRLEARTAHLMPEEFWLPAGGLVGSEKKLRVLAERRDAAKMIVRFFVESLEEMEYTPEQIETVKEEIKKITSSSSAGWTMAEKKLPMIVCAGSLRTFTAWVPWWSASRVKNPFSENPFSRKIFDFLGGLSSESTRGGGNLEILCGHPAADRDHPPSVHRTER